MMLPCSISPRFYPSTTRFGINLSQKQRLQTLVEDPELAQIASINQIIKSLSLSGIANKYIQATDPNAMSLYESALIHKLPIMRDDCTNNKIEPDGDLKSLLNILDTGRLKDQAIPDALHAALNEVILAYKSMCKQSHQTASWLGKT
jgi:hypothetical protein